MGEAHPTIGPDAPMVPRKHSAAPRMRPVSPAPRTRHTRGMSAACSAHRLPRPEPTSRHMPSPAATVARPRAGTHAASCWACSGASRNPTARGVASRICMWAPGSRTSRTVRQALPGVGGTRAKKAKAGSTCVGTRMATYSRLA
jgi:hypothetical protein